jgi:drug/metabolite transporter (DMT)-like permease
MNKTNKGVILALITVLCWGVLAIGLKVAVGKVDSFTIVWVRFSFAFAALAVWFLFTARDQFRILAKPPWELVVATLGLSINYIGFQMGVKLTSPSNAQVIIQIGPVLLALSGIFFFHEKVKKQQILGFSVVIVGFVLFYYEQLKNVLFTRGDFNAGVLFTVLAAVSWALYAIMQKKLVHRYPPQTLNLFLYGLPTLLYLPFANFITLGSLSFEWWLLLLFLGANTLIAYGCMNASLKYIDANKVSAIIINNPILTFIIMAILSWLQVGWITPEHFSIFAWAGALMFIFGAFMVVRAGNKNS